MQIIELSYISERVIKEKKKKINNISLCSLYEYEYSKTGSTISCVNKNTHQIERRTDIEFHIYNCLILQ